MKHPFFKRLILVFAMLALVAFCVQLNDVAKPQLVNTQGRTFERATVTEIVRDNLQENGSRIGDPNGLDIVLMQGLSGGIGIILTVPFAASASSWLLLRKGA